MKLYMGCDHAAFEAKELLKKYLLDKGIIVEDLGTHSSDRCDYPEFAASVSKSVSLNDGKGVILCGSGIGVSMVANRFQGIRAALCHSVQAATLSRQHNDSNILCLGARINSSSQIEEITNAWMDTEFEEGRHSGRLALFQEIGADIK